MYVEHYPWVYSDDEWRYADPQTIWLSSADGKNWSQIGEADQDTPKNVRLERAGDNLQISLIPPYFRDGHINIYVKPTDSTEFHCVESIPFSYLDDSFGERIQATAISLSRNQPLIILIAAMRDGYEMGFVTKVYTP